jgi:hypothetical protein
MHPSRPARRLIDHLRYADWLHHDRVVAWGQVLLVLTALAMLFLRPAPLGLFALLTDRRSVCDRRGVARRCA